MITKHPHFELLGLVQYNLLYISILGIKKGDRVALYMPMILQLQVAMLACARIGAIHSIVVSESCKPKFCHPHIQEMKLDWSLGNEMLNTDWQTQQVLISILGSGTVSKRDWYWCVLRHLLLINTCIRSLYKHL